MITTAVIATAVEAGIAAIAEAIAVAEIRVMSRGPGMCAVGYRTSLMKTIKSDDPNDPRLRHATTATTALGSVITAFLAPGRTTCRHGRAVFVRGCRTATRTRSARMNSLVKHAANASDLATMKLATDLMAVIRSRIDGGLLKMLGHVDLSDVYRALAMLVLVD